MNFSEYLGYLVNDHTIRTISLGTAIIGIVCGLLGTFAVLRRQSLLGDAISHASLPGIAIAFMITGSKEPLVLFSGAIISGLIGTLWIMGITRKTHLKSDTALGIILSVFFGVGMLLLTIIQKQPNANQAGLDKFLFGQAATLMVRDIYILGIVGGISVIFVLVFFKEFKILSFDAQYAKTLGFNITFLDIMLTALIVIAIVLGLQTVGVVLMSAMIIAPAAAARQWTNKLEIMVVLSAIFGAVSGVAGTTVSASMDNMSTGPVIVLIAFILVIISFLFAPNRGLIYKTFRKWKNRKDLKNELSAI
jgi:manganese/zinc/iron transport system permease protein